MLPWAPSVMVKTSQKKEWENVLTHVNLPPSVPVSLLLDTEMDRLHFNDGTCAGSKDFLDSTISTV